MAVFEVWPSFSSSTNLNGVSIQFCLIKFTYVLVVLLPAYLNMPVQKIPFNCLNMIFDQEDVILLLCSL